MKRLLQALGLKRRHSVMPDAARWKVVVRSSLDRARQPCLFIPAASTEPRPLLVYLHPWRHGYDFDSRPWQAEAARRLWHFIAPHFRGPNRHAKACASRYARQDVLDAVAYAQKATHVDAARIYLGGVSGGGHMTLVMAAETPHLWAAASAWCPISDLAEFYRESAARGAKIHRHIRRIVGGMPGESRKVDEALRYRSPVYHLAGAADVPLDINHGIHDGQPKGVGIQHSVWAFNTLASNVGAEIVADDALAALRRGESIDGVEDASYGRAIHLRRCAGCARLTIFDGGHEDLPGAACEWLAAHARKDLH
ncbi:MAG: prolyl oligopeptidase family serine peptidase [Candidatus Hydrogenedentes bacterium]|nr:prolyl oligopeptidase family serine peptidase [Candidatus Hydrogenedentota bacterium]